MDFVGDPVAVIRRALERIAAQWGLGLRRLASGSTVRPATAALIALWFVFFVGTEPSSPIRAGSGSEVLGALLLGALVPFPAGIARAPELAERFDAQPRPARLAAWVGAFMVGTRFLWLTFPAFSVASLLVLAAAAGAGWPATHASRADPVDHTTS